MIPLFIDCEKTKTGPGVLHAKLFAIAHKVFQNKNLQLFQMAKKYPNPSLLIEYLKPRLAVA